MRKISSKNIVLAEKAAEEKQNCYYYQSIRSHFPKQSCCYLMNFSHRFASKNLQFIPSLSRYRASLIICFFDECFFLHSLLFCLEILMRTSHRWLLLIALNGFEIEIDALVLRLSIFRVRKHSFLSVRHGETWWNLLISSILLIFWESQIESCWLLGFLKNIYSLHLYEWQYSKLTNVF